MPPESDTDGDDGVRELDEQSFEALEDEVDRLAAGGQSEPALRRQADFGDRSQPIRSDEDFEAAVGSAIDELPDEFRKALEDVVIVVSDDGHKENLYGVYVGHTAGYEFRLSRPESHVLPDEIVIYRDTLTRDFGDDPARLRSEITRTVRHEVAHHFGFDEPEVHGLGL